MIGSLINTPNDKLSRESIDRPPAHKAQIVQTLIRSVACC